MIDYTKKLPKHIDKYIGENDLFLEIYKDKTNDKKPPLLFIHGAYTGSWMWSKYIPHFVDEGWNCYVMNMRSHYKSRGMDLTKISIADYLDDIREVITECGEPPVIIGFSMGGILSQKIAEEIKLAGLILIDTTICKEVYEMAPYKSGEMSLTEEIIEPSPNRDEISSIDESADDIAFERKYLQMESSKARNEYGDYEKDGGISVNNSLVNCPCFTISAVASEEDDVRGKATATYFNAQYLGLWNTTHTGLLVGQRYNEVVVSILKWLGTSLL
ncbi:MAG: alpha/beta hydrolase [Lachnotalea sp.]